MRYEFGPKFASVTVKRRKEKPMSNKKLLAVVGSILILGMAAAAEAKQASQNGTRDFLREQGRLQARTLFVDENGDGICDLMRDHDNDGIPNRQDPDWDRARDGNGFKGEEGQHRNGAALEDRRAFRNGTNRGFSNGAFRNGRGGSGSGACDGTGPRGLGTKRGGR
jgi:hypothetical protein